MLITSKHNDIKDTNRIGGKAANLFRLKQSGYDVPHFVVIPSVALEQGDQLENIANEVNNHFPDNALLAVRSSADVEDSSNKSFAGQFKSILNVRREELSQAITEVFQSTYADHLKVYNQDSTSTDICMSVIVQEMVLADCAGVVFSINPTTGKEDETVINIIAGVGEALVSGQENADSYVVSNEVIIQRHIQSKPLLNDGEIISLAKTVNDISKLFGSPQDIEFAYIDSNLKLLQSRPITTTINEEKIVYDNSNIIESYPGLTLPLTFSFIEKMYAAVYIQLSKVLGIPKRRITQHQYSYNNMLGLLNGSVYYNLNSWYTVLSLLPGYNLNAEFMETMMGVKDKPELLIKEPPRSSFRDYLYVAKAILHISYNAFTVKKQKKKFIADFHDIYDRFEQKDYSDSSLEELFKDYYEFERLMSAKWKAPLVNDFFAMIYFGILQKQCQKYVPEQSGLHNELLADTKDIITTQPLRLIPELINTLTSNKEVKRLLLHESSHYIWGALQNPQFEKEYKAVTTYLNTWGERCVAELKLETITYKQAPEKLIAVIKEYTVNDIKVRPFNDTTSSKDAYDLVLEHIGNSSIKKRIFKHVLNKAKYLVANRENLRYYRTLGFGRVRSFMINIGKRLVEQNRLDNERDVFYLKLDELDQTIRKQEVLDLKQLVSNRKREYNLFNDLPLPERVITNGKQSIILEKAVDTENCNVTELQGIPCSPGVVRATICKVTETEHSFPKDQIMATYATDPGYVVMFPAASGILTERGSLLSHAAIVSREMNIPCIVGITGLMEQLKAGDEVIMDGSTGIVKIIKRGNNE